MRDIQILRKLGSMITVRTVLLVVAIYNFGLVWRIANTWTLDCVLCPWYTEWSFWNAPTLMLLATIGLRLSGRLGNFVAVVTSSVVVVRGIDLNVELLRRHELLASIGPLKYEINPFLMLQTQHVFALVVFIVATYFTLVTFRRKVEE